MGAGGRHHRPAGELGAVAQPDDEMAGLLQQAQHLAGRRHDGPELERLGHGQGGEVAAGDPGRKPQVVLDAGAGARLAAGQLRLHGQRGEPLGGAVDRGGQPGRPGADDDEIEAALRDRLDGQAQMLGDHAGSGPADDGRAGQHHRQVGAGQVEFVDEAFDVGLGLGVEPLVGQPVAGQVLPHRQGLGEVPGPDHPDGPGRPLQQPGPAGDEGAEDGVGQAGRGGDQPAELGHADLDDLPGLDHPGGEIDPLAGEQVELAEEPAGAVGGQDHLLPVVGAGDLDHP